MPHLSGSRPNPLAVVAFTLLAGAFVSNLAYADGPPAPPAEAYTACESKAAGDSCTVTLHDRTVDGTCDQRPSDDKLSCRPSRPPIPQAAFTACDGKAQAAACTVSFDGHTIDGTCETAPGGSGLACRPSGPPPDHQ